MPYKNKEDRRRVANVWARKNKTKIYAQKLARKAKKAARPKPDRCEVCERQSFRITFDHSHATGKFRGWLCHSCNIVLGHVADDPNILWRLGLYLKQIEVYGRKL